MDYLSLCPFILVDFQAIQRSYGPKVQNSKSHICQFLGVWDISAIISKNEGTFRANIYMGINTKGPRLLYANIKEIHI